MRLICPNCGAQYEVADDVIPEGGRDVQCSNCGHAWFEEPGASEKDEAVAMQQAEQSPAAPPASPPSAEPEQDPEPDPEPETETEAEDEAERWQEPEPEPETPQASTEPRTIDPEIADILREEAAFEQAARQSEASALETQTEMGLDSTEGEDKRSREARDRLSRLRGEPQSSVAPATEAPVTDDTPRRELLPDIEEINSTLRSDSDRAPASHATTSTPAKPSGFLRGFSYSVIIALLGLAAYVYAPQIIETVPAAEPALTAYVSWVDQARLWLDTQMQSLLSDQASESAAPVPEPETATGTDG